MKCSSYVKRMVNFICIRLVENLIFMYFVIRSPFSLSICVCMQALDTFNTAVVSPIYYVMFTSLTILASVIMFKVNFFGLMK